MKKVANETYGFFEKYQKGLCTYDRALEDGSKVIEDYVSTKLRGMVAIPTFENMHGTFSKYDELIPDYLVETFYRRIELAISRDSNFNTELEILMKINGKIPDVIVKLLGRINV